VFIGGHAVVNGAAARPLTLGTAADGSPEISVGSMHVTNDVGGELGGVLTAHATISGWIDELDQFTTTFATAVNGAHAAGFDATGAAGGDLFSFDPTSPGASITVSTALEDPTLLAVAGAATAAPGDGDNLASMLTLESSAIFSSSTRTAGQALSDFSSGVGSDVSAAGGDADVLDAQLSDAEAQRNALASVDTDEEAIRLVEYQTAYKAAARVLSVGDEMLRTLLQTVGG
jgi:flagellar hook-associated protein 1 FlgK